MIYIEIIDNKPTRSTSFEQIGKNYQNVVTTDYEDYTVNNRKYIFENGEVKLNPNWEEEKAQKERERIGELSMTRGDVFEALILAKGVDKAQVRQIIESKEGISDIERVLYLNRFDEALNFYRKYPVIDLIGREIGITSAQLDKFFETGDYKQLCN